MTGREITIGYGHGSKTFSVADEQMLQLMQANPYQAVPDQSKAVHDAIARPIGSRPLAECVRPGERVAIIVSDITRPCPTDKILPPLLDALNIAGIADRDITVVFALGIHRPHSEAERIKLIGEAVWQRIRAVDSDPEDTIDFGQTRLGTPVHITREAARADRRILVGNIEYHYFAGYSGGAKALMPGVSSRQAIQANHSRMIEPTSVAGSLETNRLRLDLEEAADRCGCDFIVNVVLDEKKEIAGVFAGDHRAAHRAGCQCLDQLYKVRIPQLADLVIATPGGYPKDINLYQTQKALDNARYAVKPGGIIILAGACTEGFGEDVFQNWLESAARPADLIDRISTNFELGGHKAAAIAMVLARSEVWFVSDMPLQQAQQTMMKPCSDLAEAVSEALSRLGPDARVIVMPHAGSTLPTL